MDDALAKYAQEFERAYTASEIDALLALLRSDPGHKLERTLQSAMLEVTRIQSERHLALQRKLERLVRQLTQRAVEFQRTGK